MNAAIVEELRDAALFLAEIAWAMRVVGLDGDEAEERAERLLRLSVQVGLPYGTITTKPRRKLSKV